MTFCETFPRLADQFQVSMMEVVGALRELHSSDEILRTIVLPTLIQIEDMFGWLITRHKTESENGTVQVCLIEIDTALENIKQALLEPQPYSIRRDRMLNFCDQFMHIVTKRTHWFEVIIYFVFFSLFPSTEID